MHKDPCFDLSQIRLFLHEDLGDGDLTSDIVSIDLQAKATVIARETAVLCGTQWFSGVFQLLDPVCQVRWNFTDGKTVGAGAKLCSVQGTARALLSGERTALNWLQTLSATATRSRAFADAVQGTGARVLDTRKTLPGLRQAQKYAVRCGGCTNHRMGLYDGILIKENHIFAAGSIQNAVRSARALHAGVAVEVEVESLAELEQALDARVKRVLLDNFDLDGLR
ncbi:MAG: carboxylating nicotinate-nucleotide diphosphorylase, partial [Methylococcales bacterium]